MVAQVRADYVALLFNIWEVTFGKADPKRLDGEYFEHESLSPKLIWEEKWLWRSYYRGGNPDQGGRFDCLCVHVEEDTLKLRVDRYDEDGNSHCSGTPEVEGWSTSGQDGDENASYLVNEGVSLQNFFTDPESIMDRFAQDAAKIIEALLET